MSFSFNVVIYVSTYLQSLEEPTLNVITALHLLSGWKMVFKIFLLSSFSIFQNFLNKHRHF